MLSSTDTWKNVFCHLNAFLKKKIIVIIRGVLVFCSLPIFYKALSGYAPAYSKNRGRAWSVTPVRPVGPSVRLSVRTSYFRVRAITPKPYGIYSWTFTGAYITIRRCVMNKEDNSCIFWFLNYFPLTRFHIVNRVPAITPKLYGIYSWNFTSACITLIRCVMNNSCIFCFWIIFPCLSCI